ncbi:MAG: PAS domain S-box protein [Nitrospira sp.]|nr:PAS domain S-box protein [Nitrospira sp.]
MPEQDEKIMAATRQPPAESRRNSWRYVHVEDNESEALLVEHAIRNAGYQPIMRRVETAGELSIVLRQDEWDFILADWRLPSFSALEALRVATHEAKELPVIIVSGTVGEEVAVEAVKAGAHDYVMKDRLVRLVPSIEQALRELAERQEHLRTRKRLEQSEEELRQAVTVAGIGIFRHKQLTNSLYWSPAVRAILGVGDDELATVARYIDLIHPEDRVRVQAEMAQASEVTGSGLFHSMHRIVRPDGTLRWIQVHSQTLFDGYEGGRRPYRTIGAIVDITKLKRTEVALQEIVTRFDLAVRGSRDGIWDIAPDPHDPFKGDSPIYFSPRMKEIMGVDRSYPDILRTWTDLVHPDDRESMFDALKRHFVERAPYDIEYRIVRPNGECRWIAVRGSAQWSENGQINRMSGSFSDITERRQTEEGLHEASQRFAVAFNEAPIGMAIVSQEYRLVRVNKALCGILGYSEEELVGQSVFSLSPQDDLEKNVRMFQDLVAGQAASTDCEKQCFHKKGHVVQVQVSMSLVRDLADMPQYFIAQVQDITERKAAEQELMRTQLQLQQAQKMEAIGLLAGGIAHDFNNLLTVIIGYADLQLRQVERPEGPLAKNLEAIATAAERASWLTRQLLTFSRHQVLMPKVLDVNKLISNFEKMLKRLVREDIILTTRLDATAPFIKVDPGQLEQVLMNLVVNARDAMPNGGHLTIETHSFIAEGASSCRGMVLPSGRYAMLSVCDTGQGMDAETKQRAFEPFFTTKDAGKGTGLGLSTVYGIIKQSHGFIDLSSEPNYGTTVTLCFPAIAEDVSEEVSSQSHGVTLTGIETILLVEDAAPIRELMKTVLEAAGYRVYSASCLQEAVQIVEKEEQPMHLLVTDVIMPGGNGVSLGERVKAFRPDIKILYVSGYTGLEGANQRILATGGQLLPKPFSPSTLLTKVREVLDGGPVAGSQIS